MPSNKPHFSLVISEEMLKKIDDMQFTKRYRSRNNLINELIQLGYEEMEKEMNAKEKAPESDESETEAVQDPLEALADILGKAGWLGEDGDISDADFRFLSAMLDAIRAHFN